MLDINLNRIEMSLEQVIGLEEVYLVDNCLIRTLSLEQLRKNPKAYFTTKRVLDEHKRWKEIESRPFLEREQRQGLMFRFEEIENSLKSLNQITRSKEYLDISEAAKLCDELEGTQTHDFEVGILYFARHNSLIIDLAENEQQKQELRKYFRKLQERKLLLEEYSIDIKIEENNIKISNGKDKVRYRIRDLDDLKNRFDYEKKREELEQEKKQFLEKGTEFFRAEVIANCFEIELKDQILHMHAGGAFERYSRLLTKKIVADILKENKDYAHDLLRVGRVDYVVGIGISEYKKRIKDLDLDGVISQDRIEHTKRDMYTVIERLKQKLSKGININEYFRQFDNSIKSDLGLVYAAFSKRFSAKRVTVLSEDRDVQELVDYLNLARQAGKISSCNKEIAYATQVKVAA